MNEVDHVYSMDSILSCLFSDEIPAPPDCEDCGGDRWNAARRLCHCATARLEPFGEPTYDYHEEGVFDDLRHAA